MDEIDGEIAAVAVLNTKRRPTAIVCYNDNVACGVQNELFRQGVDEIAVTGFDNTYIARLERISLTSIAQNVEEIVHRSVGALTDAYTVEKDILITPELVIRNSTTAKI
jgi:DNA-binding LacI/PurR family transcriptional regulator